MNKFDTNKLYIFSKEKYKLHNGKITPMAELLNNRIVNVENKYIGTITVDNEEYIVFPHNCIEISPEVYSDESGNIYNEIEEQQDENILLDKKSRLFLNKLFQIGTYIDEEKDKEYTLSFSNEDDMKDITTKYNERIEKFDMNKRYVFDKTLISDDIDADDWKNRLDGKEVDVRNELLGYIYDEESDFYYFISPRWCQELKED